jgi:fatty-acyl-CoA synthase
VIHPYAYYLARAARRYPERLAVIEGAARMTYRELDARASALVQANTHEFMEALAGAAMAGAAFVPMLGTLTEADHAFMARDCDARVIIAPAASLARRAAALRAAVPAVEHVIAVGSDGADDDYDVALRTHAGEAPVVRGSEDDVAQILYTSGTTGRPKGVVHSYASTQAAMFAWVMVAQRQPGDVALLYTPMSHFAARLMDSGWVAGGTAVILPAPDPAATFAAIERHRVTHLLAIPTLLQAFLDHPALDRHDLSSLRFICYAAAPASSALVRRAIARFGPILHTGWGGTEAYGLNTHMTPAEHQTAVEGHEARLSSCGRENSLGGRVRVLDDRGRDVAVGEVGEACVRAPWTMAGYWRQPELTAQTIVDGWLHFGDLARVDEDGYVYLVDRKGDMIITGGMNVYPREVEEALSQHPAVLEVAVVGVPDARWGEAVKAVIALRSGQTAGEAELIAFAKTRLAPFKVPKSVELRPALPKTPVGKISRRDVKAPYWAGQERLIHGAGGAA